MNDIELWTQIDIEPYYLAPNKPNIRHLMVVEEYRGKLKQMSYHDETPIQLVLKWVHPVTKQEKDFNWETTPSNVQNLIHNEICTRRNPWIGCHWSDDFVSASGNTIYKIENIPIGD